MRVASKDHFMVNIFPYLLVLQVLFSDYYFILYKKSSPTRLSFNNFSLLFSTYCRKDFVVLRKTLAKIVFQDFFRNFLLYCFLELVNRVQKSLFLWVLFCNFILHMFLPQTTFFLPANTNKLCFGLVEGRRQLTKKSYIKQIWIKNWFFSHQQRKLKMLYNFMSHFNINI